MKILIAIDSFKGCITSAQAAQAAAQGVADAFPDAQVTCLPVSDGGEGMLEAFQAVTGGQEIIVPAHDPLMRPIQAPYAITPDGTAIIEMAQASGLTLLAPKERNPLIATSYGTGELIVDALNRGCRRIIVGLGGSATSDCGRGMLEAMGIYFGEGYDYRYMNDFNFILNDYPDVEVIAVSDVQNPLTGLKGAAHVFARQKGATGAMIALLDKRARRFAQLAKFYTGKNHRFTPGAGAAGGMGFALMTFMNASLQSGADLLLDMARFDESVAEASMVITGEGSANAQTLMGKLPYRVMSRAKAHGVPVAMLCGQLADGKALEDAGFSSIHVINRPGDPLEVCMQPEVAMRNIRNTVSKILTKP